MTKPKHSAGDQRFSCPSECLLNMFQNLLPEMETHAVLYCVFNKGQSRVCSVLSPVPGAEGTL